MLTVSTRRISLLLGCLAVAVLGLWVGRTLGSGTATAGPDGRDFPAPRTVAATAALADGVVTQEEHDAAFAAFEACFRAGGFDYVAPPTVDRFGQPNFELMRVDGAANEPADDFLLVEECRREHYDAIQFAWARQHQPTADDFAEARKVTAACLRARGVAIDEEPSAAELAGALAIEAGEAAPAASAACLHEAAEELNWPGYSGG